jgi:hypothetical protein
MNREISDYILKLRQIYRIGGECWVSMKTMINIMHHEAMSSNMLKNERRIKMEQKK